MKIGEQMIRLHRAVFSSVHEKDVKTVIPHHTSFLSIPEGEADLQDPRFLARTLPNAEQVPNSALDRAKSRIAVEGDSRGTF